MEFQISGSASSFCFDLYPHTVNPAGSPWSNDTYMYYAELAARREATGIWLHLPLPPSLRKTAASLWGLNALSVKFISVSGNVFTERNSFHSKSRREGRLQTLGEALGSQPGWRHCSSVGGACRSMYIVLERASHLTQRGRKTRSSSATSDLLVWATPGSPIKETGERELCLLSFIMSRHCYVFYIHWH